MLLFIECMIFLFIECIIFMAIECNTSFRPQRKRSFSIESIEKYCERGVYNLHLVLILQWEEVIRNGIFVFINNFKCPYSCQCLWQLT